MTKLISIHAPHIYLAGPMGTFDAIAANVVQALHVADQLFALGFVVHVPHLMVHWDKLHAHTHEEWMALDFAVISRCDALFRMEGHSPGADREVEFAKQHEIPVLTSMYEARLYIAGCRAGTRSLLGS